MDPGSRHTGIAVFTARSGERRGRYAIPVDHRGAAITKKMRRRAAYRRRRRTANLRHRPPRFSNRSRPDGWPPPSTRHRFAPGRAAVIRARAKASLRDAAAVQSTRWELWRALDERLPTHTGSGGRTKWNRTRNRLPESHTLDALAVGSLDTITGTVDTALVAGCAGRGSSAGTHTGRVAVRSTGRFNITTGTETLQGIGHRHVRLLQRADGYACTTRPETETRPEQPEQPEQPAGSASGRGSAQRADPRFLSCSAGGPIPLWPEGRSLLGENR
ncbi:RRXRR domain-containing protein [Actinomadura algeriensis]|uniref:RRXRR domain-containing protein n=1 Tax=Actinomadura algeriensis TaxID=1679523 RepID=A0ABR9JID1_9ACTN|nr:RRXRR domain-containing protein [Actinomadura algeriensis]MBE1530304.1 hypothetical protein [Actinomadura algeriensis]